MNDKRLSQRPRFREWVAILAVFAAAVFGAAWLGRSGARSMNVAAGIVITAGTVTVAALTRRYSRLPTWATAVAVSLFGVSAIGGAALWSESAAWHHAIKDSLWMHPWYFLTLVGASGSCGSCAPGSRALSWLFIGVAFFLAVLVPVIGTLI